MAVQRLNYYYDVENSTNFDEIFASFCNHKQPTKLLLMNLSSKFSYLSKSFIME